VPAVGSRFAHKFTFALWTKSICPDGGSEHLKTFVTFEETHISLSKG
jgi:hypothetical protein